MPGKEKEENHQSKDFRKERGKRGINANVCFDKRNGNTDRDEYFDKELYAERYAVERTNAWIDRQLSLITE